MVYRSQQRICRGIAALAFFVAVVSHDGRATADKPKTRQKGAAMSVSAPEAHPAVTLRGLLHEMVDPDAVARWPQPAFTVRQTSSYDRSRIGPGKPGWFANNDSSNFLRDEVHDGRSERVMLDADGPGAVVRFFLTSSGQRAAHIRVYLDGADTPAIEWPTFDLLDGGLKVDPPLLERHPAPLGHGGSTLYLPIPYAKHCKVTLEESDPAHAGNRYYHIDYRTYSPDTAVMSFTTAAFEEAQPEIHRVNQRLSKPPEPITTTAVGFGGTLTPGATQGIDLPEGQSAVRQLELSVGADLPVAAREQALRSVVLRATFDGETDAVWCPVGDFSGSGAGGRPVASWYRTVDDIGHAVCRWTMPYRAKARLSLQNIGDLPVHIRMIARVGPWVWNNRSMYFHCSWHQQVHIPARTFLDWNFVSVTGRGVLVGDVMSVYNPIPSWYGEGNEKIWVDGESFPSHLGTGTEDYYNASWAPNPIFQTPFSNHPRMDEPRSQGQNVYTRSRNLDTISFNKSLKFDFEIITWNDSHVDYAATTYWYGAPGARCNVVPEPDEARRPVPALPAPVVVQGAVECETLPIVAQSSGLVVEPQDMSWASSDLSTWSAHAHLLLRGKHVGDYVELAIPAAGMSPRRVTLYATRANDYGILKFSVNGHRVAEAFDGYGPNPASSGPIPLGVFAPKDGKFLLRAELVGTNPKSVGFRYLAGLDAVVVSEQ